MRAYVKLDIKLKVFISRVHCCNPTSKGSLFKKYAGLKFEIFLSLYLWKVRIDDFQHIYIIIFKKNYMKKLSELKVFRKTKLVWRSSGS